MKKVLALVGLAVLGISIKGQPRISEAELSAITWPMDTMYANFHMPVLKMTRMDTTAMNIHGFAKNDVPTYDAQVIADRIRDLGSAIPFIYNADVQAFIDLYVLRRREQVSRMLGLQYVYFPMFEEMLDREGLPMELKYLPVIESALNPHAVSRAGATGLWQFMYTTGKMYNLQVTSYVDERRDPYKETIAAVTFLKSLYKSYGDWLLCIAAYNCGPGNVNRAIARSGGGKKTFWEIEQYLPRETRGYVPAFIAANYIFKYAPEHNLYPVSIDFNYERDTVMIPRLQVTLQQVAKVTGTDFYTLKDLNPELKTNTIPYDPIGYMLRVPHKTALVFEGFRDSIFKQLAALPASEVQNAYDQTKISPITNRPYETGSTVGSTTQPSNTQTAANNGSNVTGVSTPNGILVYYTVKTGDIVAKIAPKYYVTAADIANWNNLRNYMIYSGQKLKIYVPEKYAAALGIKTEPKPDSNAVNTPANNSAVTNQTTNNAANQSGTTNNTIKVNTPVNNSVDPNSLGDSPPKQDGSSSSSVVTSDHKYYKVQEGDTLQNIALKYQGLTVDKIKELNQVDESSLKVGQVLVVQ